MNEGALTPTRRSADLRRRNSVDVVDLLRQHGRLSRAELATHTTLSNQALATILNGLVETGHVVEVETRSSVRGRGRPALRYEYNADRVRVVSLYVGLRYTEIALCDGLGRAVTANVEITPGWDVDRVVGESSEAIGQLLDVEKVDRAMCHVAVVVHGLVDTAHGTASSPGMGWNDVAVAELIAEHVGTEVTVHEASRAAAIAEYREGAAAGAGRAMVLNLGPETTATEVDDGVLDVGSGGLAGMVGRCRVASSRGVLPLDEMIGSFASKRRYNELSGEHVDWLTDVYARARAGDPHARSVLDLMIEGIAFASMWLITICNPERFVVTGAIGEFDERAKSQLLGAIVGQIDERMLRDCSIQFSTLGRQAWIRGGVHAALDHQRALEQQRAHASSPR